MNAVQTKDGQEVLGSFVSLLGGRFYKISNVHKMSPFFISLASGSDIFMFLSSNGSLTAGRQNIDRAIFPYETDDKIHLNTAVGPKTVIKIKNQEQNIFWEPFSQSIVKDYAYRRNLYKSIWGDSIIYEEINDTLQLSFSYQWELSEKFGMVRTSFFKNLSGGECEAEILDGVLNILPSGIQPSLNDIKSCLTDAYKVAELDEKTGLSVYFLTSKINDVPEPVEVLTANIAYAICTVKGKKLLSDRQIRDFVNGEEITTEAEAFGKKGAYFTYLNQRLGRAGQGEDTASWVTVLDVTLTHGEIAALQKKIYETEDSVLLSEIRKDIEESTNQLIAINAAGDGLQCTGDETAARHHYVNVLYNNMRGGIFDNGYRFEYEELVSFVELRNKGLFHKHSEFFEDIKAHPDVLYLKRMALLKKDADLVRICFEFLPICFSRRHGDPSRPWNKFFIKLKNEEGKRLYHYEGNWRDIFQNWEAMCFSFPEYLENIIAKFLNASTADGYNPYRISREGIDWEVPDPEDPFSGLGYWGDHQIIYLLRLLEALYAHDPAAMDNLFDREIFCYANVPYRIKGYESILKNSKSTVEFDWDNTAMKLAGEMGSDGKLILTGSRQVYYVSFIEKLLVPILAKVSNLVVGGGIWLNTERPEWNDANNALVGNGLSMVTVYQLRRHIQFCKDLIEGRKEKKAAVSREVDLFLKALGETFSSYAEKGLSGRLTESDARKILDANGYAFEKYRGMIYENGFSGEKTAVAYKEIAAFFADCLALLDYTVDCSKREDGLYHAYNIVSFTKESLQVLPLFAMLEGQTAIAACKRLTVKELLGLINAMESSDMYSKEQQSFYLYPLRRLRTFMEKNSLDREDIASSKVLSSLLQDKENSLIYEDVFGIVRFKSEICDLKHFIIALEKLKEGKGEEDKPYAQMIEEEYDLLCGIFDHVFGHKEFTGRSGRMYKYEGIGCIYWHQNAKFLLSVAESFFEAANSNDLGVSEGTAQSSLELVQLKEAYYRLREGLGFSKSPKTFGAFPLDPYSHTPYLQGAQQPGMTGQVKEEILTRRLELGILVSEGRLSFLPRLLRESEFLTEETSFEYIDLNGERKELIVAKGELAFTLCQIPVLYRLSEENKIILERTDGKDYISSLCLNEDLSKLVFARDHCIKGITVYMKKSEMI